MKRKYLFFIHFYISTFLFIILISCSSKKDYSAESNFIYLNSIWLDVEIDNKATGKFILDLGSSATILDSQFATKNNIRPDTIGFYEVVGSGNSDAVMMPVLGNLPIKVLNKNIDSSMVLIMNLKKIIPIEDGIIGIDFFIDRIIFIDYENQRIEEIQDKNLIDKDYKQLPITFLEDGRPYVKLKIVITDGITVEGLFLIDTGNELAIKLDNYYTDSLDLFNKIDKKLIKNVKDGGIGGTTYSFLIKGESAIISDFEVNNVLISCSQNTKGAGNDMKYQRIGTIGNLFLEKFHIIINISENKIYLKPNNNYTKKFTYVRSGISLGTLTDEGFEVKSILNDSPANEIDIKEGDIITHINGQNTIPLGYFKTRQLLQTKGTVDLKIKRYNVVIEKNLTIYDLMQKL